MKTAFYIYGNIRLKEISILNSFEQIQENTIAGSAFLAPLSISAVAFIPDWAIVRQNFQMSETFLTGLDTLSDCHFLAL